MIRKFEIYLLTCLLCFQSSASAMEKDENERNGTVSGELKSRKESKDGRSVTIEILAPGEEKPRRYLVSFNPRDPKAEAPFKVLRDAVNKATIGDRVRIAWVNSPKGSEGGFFVTAFEVLTQLPHLAQNGNYFRPVPDRKLLISNDGISSNAM